MSMSLSFLLWEAALPFQPAYHSSRKNGEGTKEPAQGTGALPLWDGEYEREVTPSRPLLDIND